MTVITDSVPKLKLKIKISSKTIEVEPRNKVCDVSQQLWMNDDQRGYSISQKSVTKMSHNIVHQTLDHPKVYDATDNVIIRSAVQCSVKRGPTSVIECQAQKRQKMDCSVKQQCGSIIDSLLSKDFSAGFREPVDPVALRIPDYFQVIKEPMDLGTVRTKLEDDMYSSVEEFLADVRLIFSNAMKYNPPTDYFHKAAKKLETLFSTKWKSLEAKWKRERINVEQSWIVSCSKQKTQETSSIDPRNSPVRVSCSLSETTFMSTDEKRELSKNLVAALRGNMTQQLQMLVKELGSSLQKVEKSEFNLDGFEDATLWQLKSAVKCSLDAKASKVERAKLVQNSRCTLEKVSHKGQVSGHRSTCRSVSAMPPLSMSASKCRLCGNMRCGCSLQNDIPHRSFINLTVEKLSGQGRGASKPDPDEKSILTSTISTPDPQYDACTPGIDIQLSPGKALRAAMLKSRFADTILKAKQITLCKHDCKVDPVKLQQEKERLERQQREEAARIEAQIKAAEAASALRAEEELRLQREREREAARIALQKMEKTVEVEDNMKILEELEMFIRRVTPDHLFYRPSGSEVRLGEGIGYFRYPLERFGLYVKEDYTSDEDIENEVILQEDKEEGEILF